MFIFQSPSYFSRQKVPDNLYVADYKKVAVVRSGGSITQSIKEGKDPYFCPSPLLKPNESKRENTHVCFPNRRLLQPASALQAAVASPRLALAMSAVITLPAPLLVHHRVTATLWTEITGDAQMTQA